MKDRTRSIVLRLTAASALFLMLVAVRAWNQSPVLPNPLTVDLVLTPGQEPRSDPLIVAGETGRGDFLAVRLVDAGTVTFLYDSWGYPALVSSPVRLEPGARLRLQIEMPALDQGGDETVPPANRVRVVANGVTVLDHTAHYHPRAPERIFFAENPIGGSACGPFLRGRILSEAGRELRGPPNAGFPLHPPSLGRLLRRLQHQAGLAVTLWLGCTAAVFFAAPLATRSPFPVPTPDISSAPTAGPSHRPGSVFFPNLDGLRFLAFLAVFVSHSMNLLGYSSNHAGFNATRDYLLLNGDLGVNFFFVLSGFLIVYLLIQEKEVTGRVHLGSFYVRRVLRIWPLYFLILGLGWAVLPLLQPLLPTGFPLSAGIDRINLWLYLVFLGNFDLVNQGSPNQMIGVLWSVSVEEQFYLLCPCLVAVCSPRRLLPAFLLIITASLLFRWIYAPGGGMVFKYHSLACTLYLATGATLACLARTTRLATLLGGMPRLAIIAAYGVGLGLLPLRRVAWTDPLPIQLLPVAQALFFAFVIAEQNYARHSFYKIGRSEWLSAFGRWTYGMYCYHMMAFFLVMFAFHTAGLQVTKLNSVSLCAVLIGALATTIVISNVSYRYFELGFLNLKRRFAFVTKV